MRGCKGTGARCPPPCLACSRLPGEDLNGLRLVGCEVLGSLLLLLQLQTIAFFSLPPLACGHLQDKRERSLARKVKWSCSWFFVLY